MKQIDWSVLLTGLIALIVSIVLGISIVIASQQYYKSTKKWQKKQQANFMDMNEDYFRLEEALKMVDNLYNYRLQQFKNKGFFVQNLLPDKRLEIHEEVDKLFNDKLKSLLFEDGSSYEVLEQNLYDIPKFLGTDPQFKTYQTPIHLKLALLHEGDIFKLLERVEFHNYKFTGLMNLQSCSIQSSAESIDTNNVSNPYLNADCIWVWYISTI
ncbi:hypothetical protein QUF74_14100 [Candidatus Halobeggiatoa sp. HSG11]|nr:hypothetical protein [Candidatus Halobeggiatoa sp. HSG11]